MKQVLGAVGVLVALGLVWFFTQGPGVSMIHPTAQVAQSTQPVAAVQPAPAMQAAADAQPAGFQPAADALQSIKANGIVRVSNENPSEPFFGVTNGAPHGFNVEFAKLLFGDASFASAAHPSVALDFNHSVDTYAGVPQQLLAKDASGNAVVDVAMDGLTQADNTPAGVVYSVPYVDDFGYALITQRGSAIKSTNDLVGKTVGILKGDPDVKAYVSRTFPGTRFVEVDDADAGFLAKTLDAHQADAFIYDYPFAVESIKNTDLQFAMTKLDGSNIAYKIGVRAQDQNLLIYLNAAIAKLKNTPAYLDLLRKYFTSSQTVTTAAGAGERTYAVKSGDTLNTIAVSQLGSGQRFREIQKRNNLANPNLILIGQKLVIPAR